MLLKIVTQPSAEPLSLGEAKGHLRLETTEDDADVMAMILSARRYVEEHCGRGLVTQTWDLYLEGFPAPWLPPLIQVQGFSRPIHHHHHDHRAISLALGGLASVVSVTYLDTNGVRQTLATSEYDVDDASEPGRILLAYGKNWPEVRRQWDAVKIRFTVGDEPKDVDEPIKSAMRLLVAQMYEQRVPEVTGAVISGLSFSFKALLSPYRIIPV